MRTLQSPQGPRTSSVTVAAEPVTASLKSTPSTVLRSEPGSPRSDVRPWPRAAGRHSTAAVLHAASLVVTGWKGCVNWQEGCMLLLTGRTMPALHCCALPVHVLAPCTYLASRNPAGSCTCWPAALLCLCCHTPAAALRSAPRRPGSGPVATHTGGCWHHAAHQSGDAGTDAFCAGGAHLELLMSKERGVQVRVVPRR